MLDRDQCDCNLSLAREDVKSPEKVTANETLEKEGREGVVSFINCRALPARYFDPNECTVDHYLQLLM
jgi:hypothetical protein